MTTPQPKSFEEFVEEKVKAFDEGARFFLKSYLKEAYAFGVREGFDRQVEVCTDGELAFARAAERESLLTTLRQEVEGMPTHYPQDIFGLPWEGWEADVHALAQSKGSSIDSISACYGRYMEKVLRGDILSLLKTPNQEPEK